MSWFYAEGGAQKGPVTEQEFAAMVQAGRITAATLVWREGMADWQPYATIQASAGMPAPAGAATAVPAEMAVPISGPTAVCAECGKVVAAADTVQLEGRTICASCKPRVVQRMVEGADAAGARFDADQFLARLRARGGYRFEVGATLSRGFDLVKANFWPCVGVTLLMYVVLMAASQIPCAGFVLGGPVMGGLFYYFLLQVRGRPATVNDAFIGFRQPRFRELAFAGGIITLATLAVYLVCMLPFFAVIFGASQTGQPPDAAFIGAFILLFGVLMVGVGLITLMWYPSYVILVDKGIGFWAGMELSRKLVFMRFWSWVGFSLFSFLLMMAGVLMLCVGTLVVMPVLVAAMTVAWDDILRQGEEGAAPSGVVG